MPTEEDISVTPTPTSTLLKRDVLGRVTIPKAQREALLNEFERSGLKGKPFARLVGVNYQSFASWIQKRRRARGDYAVLAAARGEALVKLELPKPLRLMEAVDTQVLGLPVGMRFVRIRVHSCSKSRRPVTSAKRAAPYPHQMGC